MKESATYLYVNAGKESGCWKGINSIKSNSSQADFYAYTHVTHNTGVAGNAWRNAYVRISHNLPYVVGQIWPVDLLAEDMS